MEIKMQHNTDFVGLAVATAAWVCMKIFLWFGNLTLAEYSSLCVMLGVAWTFIANADKAVSNLNKFYLFLKSLKLKLQKKWRKQKLASTKSTNQPPSGTDV